jgi:hypothetical protein
MTLQRKRVKNYFSSYYIIYSHTEKMYHITIVDIEIMFCHVLIVCIMINFENNDNIKFEFQTI